MDSRLVILNATLFDSITGALRPGACVIIDKDRIADVSFTSARPGDGRVVDLAGRTLLPSLIDGHVHVTATMPDLFRLSMLLQSLAR